MTGSSLTLGAAGSRRTVYLVDEKLADENAGNAAGGDADLLSKGDNGNGNGTPTDQAPSTFLMYNRISNVIGSSTSGNCVDPNNHNANGSDASNGTKEKRKPDEPGAVWYEYGCV